MAEYRIDSNGIQEAYNRLLRQIKIYDENKEYVKGKNPEILRRQRVKDPDNRIPVPLAKSAVIDMTGYAGSKIKITYNSISTEENDKEGLDKYRDLMREIQDYNNDDIITTRLYRESISHIETYLIMWTSDKLGMPDGMLTPEYMTAGSDKVVLIWDNGLKPELKAACYFVKENDTIDCDVYYPFVSEHYRSNGGGKWNRIQDLDQNYPYTQVPVIPFKMSMDGGPIFQAEKPIIDKHDSVISKSQNEIDRFNAMIALFPFKVDAEFIQKLEQMKAIDDLSQWESWPKYLEKNLAGVNEYTNNHLDRLERLFHKTIKVVDFNQITAQGGDEAGVARAFKLLGMEFLATDIEKVYKEGLYKRSELLNDVIEAANTGLNTEKYTVDVKMERTFPIDDLSKVQIAQGLSALGVSDETVLKILPENIIPDPEKELEKMEEKKAKRAEQFNSMLNGEEDEE